MKDFKESVNGKRKIIGKLIRATRRSKDITQMQISKALGVAQPAFIQKVEAGKRNLDVAELWELCKLMGTPFLELAQKIDETLKKNDDNPET